MTRSWFCFWMKLVMVLGFLALEYVSMFAALIYLGFWWTIPAGLIPMPLFVLIRNYGNVEEVQP